MHPSPEQLAAAKCLHAEADRLIAADNARVYTAAPSCFLCGQKVMPGEQAISYAHYHRDCVSDCSYEPVECEEAANV